MMMTIWRCTASGRVAELLLRDRLPRVRGIGGGHSLAPPYGRRLGLLRRTTRVLRLAPRARRPPMRETPPVFGSLGTLPASPCWLALDLTLVER